MCIIHFIDDITDLENIPKAKVALGVFIKDQTGVQRSLGSGNPEY